METLNNPTDSTNEQIRVENSPSHRRSFGGRTILAIVAVIGLFELLGLGPRLDLGWIDPVTGSMKSQTRWFGFATSSLINKSALEEWVIRHEGGHENQWSPLYNTSKTAFGRPFCFECNLSPPIHALHAGALNDEFVRNSTDRELSQFLEIMRNGTAEEQRRAVENHAQKLFTSNSSK